MIKKKADGACALKGFLFIVYCCNDCVLLGLVFQERFLKPAVAHPKTVNG